MLRRFLLAILLLGATATQAQISAVGFEYASIYNSAPDARPLPQLTMRVPVGSANLDLGLGMSENNDRDPDFQVSFSGFVLFPVKSFDKLSLDLTGGAVFASKQERDGDNQFALFGGLTPRAQIWDHLEVAIRFGLAVPLAPDAGIETVGNQISIVEGLNFKILF